jgi:hypothetical protein
MACTSYRLTQFAVLTCVLLVWTGCNLFDPKTNEIVSHASLLKPIVPSRDVLELEVYFVDRSIGDPLIGESFWRDLSPISSVQAENRQRLQEDGFRYAMAPSRPPRALQTLLSLSNEEDPSRRVAPQRYSVMAGQDTVLLISAPPNGTPLKLRGEDGEKKIELNQAKCLIHLTGSRVDEGWARISLMPEIRHGQHAIRPIATDDTWLYNEQQQSIPLFHNRLSAELNIGEIIVVGLEPNSPDSTASRFFRADVSKGIERLVLIRVIGMKRIDPVMSSQ